MHEKHLSFWRTFLGRRNNSSDCLPLPSDTSKSQSPHAALSHYQCGDNYPPNIWTNWLFIKARASFSLGPLVPGMRRSSCVAVLVLLPLATTTALPLHPDHQTDSNPHPPLPPRVRKGYSTFRVRPRILKGLLDFFTEVKSEYMVKVLACMYGFTKLSKIFRNAIFKDQNIVRIGQETAREDKENPLQLGFLPQNGTDQCWPQNEGNCWTHIQTAN